MKKFWKRCLAVITALFMTAGTLGVAGLAGAEPVNASEDSVTVYISSQEAGVFLHPYGAYEVNADLAESYGYEDDVENGVSALDVLVKAHEEVFGKEYVKDYLTVEDGSVKNFFTEGTGSSFGFTIDGEQPHSDETTDEYGQLSYIGYNISQAKVGDGARVEFYRYMDTSYYMDYYPWINFAGERVNNLFASPSSEVTLNLEGMMIAYDGCVVEPTSVECINDAQLAWVNDKGELNDIDNAITDENGDITITIPSDASVGKQLILTAYMPQESIDNYDFIAPIVMPVITIQVTSGGEVTGTFEKGEAPADEPQGGGEDKPTDPQIDEATDAVLQHALDIAAEPAFEDDWQVMELARAGAEVPAGYYDEYYANIAEVLDKYDGKLMEGGDLPTDYAKVILALTAAGKDVTNVGGYDLTEILKDTYEKKGGTANQVSFVLIGLNAASINKNVKMDDFETELIDKLISMKNDDGGFSVAGSTSGEASQSSDVDVTAMAIQALAPYADKEKVGQALDEALEFIIGAQKESGGYSLVETSAQVVIALTALDTDPGEATDGKTDSIIDSMMDLYLGDGTFQYGTVEGSNSMSTEQGTRALVAYQRYLSSKTSLYDMSDVEIEYVADSLVNEDTGIKIEFAEGVDEKAELIIEKSELENIEDKLKEALKGLQKIYDISLQLDGEELAVSGNMMQISIPLDPDMMGYKYYQVAYIEDGVIKERIDAELVGNELVFKTDHLSQYAVLASDEPFPVSGPTDENGKPLGGDEENTGENTNVDNDISINGEDPAYKTGDTASPVLWITLLALSGAAAVIAGRKRAK